MHTSRKPVRKCNGCGLNFRDHCGVFENPHDTWHSKGKCPGYKNEAMLADYLEQEARKQVKEDKEKRKAVARERQAVPHHNGDRHVSISTP